jgi:hypothetical protein
MINCTNLKPGDKVRLRNGVIATVERNDRNDRYPINLRSFTAYHRRNGRWLNYQTHPFDIVEILANPQPEMNTNTFPFSWRDPARITVNGKQYTPAKDPSLSYPFPHMPTFTVSAMTNEVVAIIYDGKRFTPADSWPEPITDRSPTLQDANKNGEVMRLEDDGDWMRFNWTSVNSNPKRGWAKTSDWKPTPLDKKALTLRDLKEALAAGNDPEPDTIQSAIELLEAAC